MIVSRIAGGSYPLRGYRLDTFGRYLYILGGNY